MALIVSKEEARKLILFEVITADNYFFKMIFILKSNVCSLKIKILATYQLIPS